MDKVVQHDVYGQKFTLEYNGDECILAYTQVNDVISVHQIFIYDNPLEVKDMLLRAVFDYARQNGLKISDENAEVMAFVGRFDGYGDLIGRLF